VDAGLDPRTHLHDLRHAGLTLAAQSGATMKELMAIAGHSSPRAALIYQHAATDRAATVAAALSERLSQPGDLEVRKPG
jgi:integrase